MLPRTPHILIRILTRLPYPSDPSAASVRVDDFTAIACEARKRNRSGKARNRRLDGIYLGRQGTPGGERGRTHRGQPRGHGSVARMASDGAGASGKCSADAIVVLGCRVLPSGQLTTAAEGRASAAAAAYRAGVAPCVIASGGRRWGAQIEALALRDAMVTHGVPASAIVAELWSLTTYENAVFTAALLRKTGARNAVVVTCEWHVPRALMSFRAAGIEASAWPRASRAGFYDRCAEGFRRAYDARALRRTSVLAGSADSFFGTRGRP